MGIFNTNINTNIKTIQKVRSISILALSALLFTSCKYVKIKDGRIPERYLFIAKQFEGSYPGSFQGRHGVLKIALQGTKAVLTFINGSDNDILGSECNSTIGELTYLKLGGTREKPVLQSATFKFDPGSCEGAVEGRTLQIYDSGTALEMELLEISEDDKDCGEVAGDLLLGDRNSVCEHERLNIYLTGSFRK